MFGNFNREASLSKLVKLSLSIATDEALLEEMIQEINMDYIGPICSMFKALFKKGVKENIEIYSQFKDFFFKQSSINEITLCDSPILGIKCFLMPKNSFFPLHDHPNKVVCTGVLYGKLKYLSLNPGKSKLYKLSKKGTARPADALFCTQTNKNIHSVLAIEDSIMIDIFIPNYTDDNDSNLFKIIKKRSRGFYLEKKSILDYHSRQCQAVDT